MIRTFSSDKILLFKKRKKTNKKILQLSVLAAEARINIDENQQLNDTIDILNNLLLKTKSILSRLTSKKSVSKIEIINNLKEEKDGHIKLNKNLRGDRNFMKLKYNRTNKELEQVTSKLENELNILINRKFIYENVIFEKQSLIKNLKLKINNIKLIGENKNEKYLTNMESDKIFSEVSEVYQTNLLKHFKLFNRLQNKCILLFENKKLLLDEIYRINNQTKTTSNSILSFKDDNLFQKINEEDSFLNESISSTVEEDYMNFSFIQKTYYKSIFDKNIMINHFKLPALIFEQIKYNNERKKSEEKEKSLSRVFEDSKDIKIKKLKENIKKMKNKLKQKELKCKEYEDKIKYLKNYILKH